MAARVAALLAAPAFARASLAIPHRFAPARIGACSGLLTLVGRTKRARAALRSPQRQRVHRRPNRTHPFVPFLYRTKCPSNEQNSHADRHPKIRQTPEETSVAPRASGALPPSFVTKNRVAFRATKLSAATGGARRAVRPAGLALRFPTPHATIAKANPPPQHSPPLISHVARPGRNPRAPHTGPSRPA